MKQAIKYVVVSVVAVAQVASANPYQLPKVTTSKMQIDEGVVDALVESVLNCYPEPSYLDKSGGKLQLVARAGVRQNQSNTINVSDETSNYIGVQFTLPLWSPQDVERDRTRELTRRREVASAVGKYLNALGNIAGNRSKTEILESVEKWEAIRVQEGVSPTTAQVQAINAVVDSRKDEISGLAEYHSARAELLAHCPKTERASVLNVMARLTK